VNSYLRPAPEFRSSPTRTLTGGFAPPSGENSKPFHHPRESGNPGLGPSRG
jgi:hypothetical protein